MNEPPSAEFGNLLMAGEPAPVWVENARGQSPFLLTCDHAGNRIPQRLGTLGLPAAELARHIAWDIGIAAVGRALARRLDAVCVGQTYSRLVIDCNRAPHTPESIVACSDGTVVPGNIGLSAAAIAGREREIFAPYQASIVEELDARAQRGARTALIFLHSFTPVYGGTARPWHAGVLYSRDTRLAHALRDGLRGEAGLVIGDNQPYSAEDDSDYALPRHGLDRGLPHVEIEIRQDLITDAAGQQAWADRLATLLPQALAACW